MQKGFTLIEFITVLLIAAIFIVLAVPGYNFFVVNNRIVSITNKLAASINYAKIEAIRRGEAVAICSAATAAQATCGNNSNWTRGFIIFSDSDEDSTIDTNADLLKLSEASPSGITITTASAIVSFDANGFVSTGGTSFTISGSSCTGNNARILDISANGRVSVRTAAC